MLSVYIKCIFNIKFNKLYILPSLNLLFMWMEHEIFCDNLNRINLKNIIINESKTIQMNPGEYCQIKCHGWT